jgi:tetratricopeptide (TPR) repeat protein
LGGLRAIWADPSATCQYYPLSFTFFWAIHHFFGFDTFAYHLVTLLMHGTAAILFWKVLERLRVRGALLAAAIFALHPVNVMSVAWMTELKNTLSCALALGAAWAYLRFAGVGVYEQMPAEKRGWRWYGLALVLFQLAMLAKTAVSFLPVTLLLVLWWQRERVTRRDLATLLPMLGISVGMGVFTIYIERHAGGASGAEFNIPFVERVLVSGRSFWFYLWKLVWPAKLTFIYPRWTLDARVWWEWVFPVGTMAVLAGTWLARRGIGKGPFVALMHFYISTSLLVLAVVLYMMRYSFVTDHWQYFGSLGICASAASGITRVMDRLGGVRLEIGVGIALVLLLGMLSRGQCTMYANIETLWRATIARNPGAWMAHTNLGGYLLRHGHADEAVAESREALRINPGDEHAYVNLGNAWLHDGNTGAAIDAYHEALGIDPNYDDAHLDLGNALLQSGSAEAAIAEYREALRINPRYAQVHFNLGIALMQRGETDAAIEEYREALRINPDYLEAHCNLGIALLQKGRVEEAIAEYREALRIDPDAAEAHYDLGNALFQQGKAAEGIAEAEEGLRRQPDNAEMMRGVAWMLATAPNEGLRNGTMALQLATEAARISGTGNAMVLRTLAAAYAEAGQFGNAVAAAQAALQRVQSESGIAVALQREIALYQAGRTFQ